MSNPMIRRVDTGYDQSLDLATFTPRQDFRSGELAIISSSDYKMADTVSDLNMAYLRLSTWAAVNMTMTSLTADVDIAQEVMLTMVGAGPFTLTSPKFDLTAISRIATTLHAGFKLRAATMAGTWSLRIRQMYADGTTVVSDATTGAFSTSDNKWVTHSDVIECVQCEFVLLFTGITAGSTIIVSSPSLGNVLPTDANFIHRTSENHMRVNFCDVSGMGAGELLGGRGLCEQVGLLVSPEVVQYVTNPYGVINLNGITSSGGTITRSPRVSWWGADSPLLTASAGNATDIRSVTVPNGVRTNITAWVWNDSGNTRNCRILTTSAGIMVTVSVPPYRLTRVGVEYVGTGAADNVSIRWTDSAASERFFHAYVGVVTWTGWLPTVFPRMDGSRVIMGGSWAGTVHDSVSTSTARKLNFDLISDAGIKAFDLDSLHVALAWSGLSPSATVATAAPPLLDIGDHTVITGRLDAVTDATVSEATLNGDSVSVNGINSNPHLAYISINGKDITVTDLSGGSVVTSTGANLIVDGAWDGITQGFLYRTSQADEVGYFIFLGAYFFSRALTSAELAILQTYHNDRSAIGYEIFADVLPIQIGIVRLGSIEYDLQVLDPGEIDV